MDLCRNKDTCCKAELRCPCHRLLAIVEGDRIVLKCPRCKTQAVVELSKIGRGVEVVFTS